MINGILPDPDAALSLSRIADTLADPRVEEHFTQNRNKTAALREVMDLFGIPHPVWARRKISGRGSVNKAMIASFLADHPQDRLRRAR